MDTKKSVYVKDFMGEDEDQDHKTQQEKDRKKFEDKKNKFDIQKVMSEFIIK